MQKTLLTMFIRMPYRLLIGLAINCVFFIVVWIMDKFNYNDDWLMFFTSIPYFIIFRLGLGIVHWILLQIIMVQGIMIFSVNSKRMVASMAMWIGLNSTFYWLVLAS